MEIYKENVNLNSNYALAGYARSRVSTQSSSDLQVNGLKFVDGLSGKSYELCAVDVLYPGDLVKRSISLNKNIIFSASHTHYAPMLDSGKPQLGIYSMDALGAFEFAIDSAKKIAVNPDVCRMYKSEVTIPIYRRFDVPNTVINRLLTKRAGMYPNENLHIDRNVYIFEFATGNRTNYVIVLHACHPVSRFNMNEISSDYIGSIRKSINVRFGSVPCIFLQGCAGDIRPNISHKRLSWLPKNRFNWRFENPVKRSSEEQIDQAYSESILNAAKWRELTLGSNPIQVTSKVLKLESQGDIEIPIISIAGGLQFEFVPFEVSHLYHLEIQKEDSTRFLVSCSNNTLGYMPHHTQLNASGYEVDTSRNCMGLKNRVVKMSDSEW